VPAIWRREGCGAEDQERGGEQMSRRRTESEGRMRKTRSVVMNGFARGFVYTDE